MMPLPEILALGIVAYLLYRLIVGFFLPIFRATRQMRQQFRDIRDAMNGNPPNGFRSQGKDPGRQNDSGAGTTNGASSGTAGSASKSDPSPSFDSIGEYIEFEEIKK